MGFMPDIYDEAVRYRNACALANEKVKQLQTKITDQDATIKHLRAKAEFNMPVDMRGRFHNACVDPCDMIDGPCACGASHSAKEWVEKLCKKIKQFQAELDKAEETITTRGTIIDELNQRLSDIGGQC